MRKAASILWAVGVLLLLAGCNPDAGKTLLAVAYPSGYVRTAYTWEELTPVEGSDFRLRTDKADDFDKTRSYDLQILDGNGTALYTFPGLGHSVVRGEAAGNGLVWICSELWNTAHHSGYLSNCLEESVLLLVDMADGSVLFRDELGENELYLTSRGSKCYFYDCGKEEQEKFFGLCAVPARPAELYARDMEKWDEKNTLYTFDYAVEPDKLDERSVQDQVCFFLDESQITVSMTAYLQVDKETNAWDNVEKFRAVIPLDTDFI